MISKLSIILLGILLIIVVELSNKMWWYKMTSKYTLHECVKYKYSDIGEYIGEGYTNRAIRNDELVEILNSQDKKIEDLEAELEDYKTLLFRKTVKWRGY